jgi:uncharacterized membrane protein
MTETSDSAMVPLARIQVSANCSLSHGQAILFFGVVAGASICVAGFFAAQGMWPVLPFAGLELFALGVALGLSMRRGRELEMITIEPDRVIVDLHGHGKSATKVFTRLWARVELRRSPRRGHPSRLVILSHNRAVEIGRIGEAPDKEPAGHDYENLAVNGVGIDDQQIG